MHTRVGGKYVFTRVGESNAHARGGIIRIQARARSLLKIAKTSISDFDMKEWTDQAGQKKFEFYALDNPRTGLTFLLHAIFANPRFVPLPLYISGCACGR